MRKEVTVTLQDGERNLTFRIRQMSAWKLERWMFRAAIQISKASGDSVAGLSVEDAQKALKKLTKNQSADSGAQKIVNIIGGLDYGEAEPLLDELLACCKLIPDPSHPMMEMDITEQTAEGQIENPLTLIRLRVEAAKLNFSFFGGALKPRKESAEPVVTIPKATRTSRR